MTGKDYEELESAIRSDKEELYLLRRIDEELDRMKEERDLLRRFYGAWQVCESSGGCYSCCDLHDGRCKLERGIGECTCGRAELEAAEQAIVDWEEK